MGYYIRSLDGVRKWRNMPWLKHGMTVEVNGKMGKVTGANSSNNINVKFNEKENQRYNGNCHPWWKTRYFDNKGNIIADYYEQ